MKIVVTGASGNVGSAVVESLVADPVVETVVGICRRAHEWTPPKTSWVFGDVAEADLGRAFRGADVVIHLAWLFQPTRAPAVTWRANVTGTQRVLAAVADAQVPSVVVASSVGAYSPRSDLAPVDESWPTDGVPSAAYSREKAYVERLLDLHEREHPARRVVRMRPVFIFSERASHEQRRLFLGPLVPHALLVPGRVPLLPLPRDLSLQALHTRDVAEAYRAAALSEAAGAFNLAPDDTAEDTLGPAAVARLLQSRWVPTPARVVRAALGTAFRLRAVPAAPELFDLAMSVPMLDASRARRDLAWAPRHSSSDAIESFLRGLDGHDLLETPPLAPATSGVARRRELTTGIGARP
jgi:UDP-glucose 4-epimerase